MTKASQESSLVDLAPLRQRLDSNPVGILAAAFGVGFVLGGGLFTRLTGRVVGAAVRLAVVSALPLLQEELFATASQLASGEKKSKGHTKKGKSI